MRMPGSGEKMNSRKTGTLNYDASGGLLLMGIARPLPVGKDEKLNQLNFKTVGWSFQQKGLVASSSSFRSGTP